MRGNRTFGLPQLQPSLVSHLHHSTITIAPLPRFVRCLLTWPQFKAHERGQEKDHDGLKYYHDRPGLIVYFSTLPSGLEFLTSHQKPWLTLVLAHTSTLYEIDWEREVEYNSIYDWLSTPQCINHIVWLSSVSPNLQGMRRGLECEANYGKFSHSSHSPAILPPAATYIPLHHIAMYKYTSSTWLALYAQLITRPRICSKPVSPPSSSIHTYVPSTKTYIYQQISSWPHSVTYIISAWLAQSVERKTLNLKVGGSTPPLGFLGRLGRLAFFAQFIDYVNRKRANFLFPCLSTSTLKASLK